MNSPKEVFSYKEYFGSAEISQEDRCLVGRVLFIDDLVMYEGETFEELERAFKESVDDYLAFCLEQGKVPAKAYSGTFNVRVGPDLHSAAARKASQANVSLNEFVRNAIYIAVFNPERASQQKISVGQSPITYWNSGVASLIAASPGSVLIRTPAGSDQSIREEVVVESRTRYLQFGPALLTQMAAEEVH